MRNLAMEWAVTDKYSQVVGLVDGDSIDEATNKARKKYKDIAFSVSVLDNKGEGMYTFHYRYREHGSTGSFDKTLVCTIRGVSLVAAEREFIKLHGFNHDFGWWDKAIFKPL